jgi:hypothetical protein
MRLSVPFLESMPGNINEITQSAASGNWEQVAKIVHKIKPTITLMGIHSLKDKVVTCWNKKRRITPVRHKQQHWHKKFQLP